MKRFASANRLMAFAILASFLVLSPARPLFPYP